MDNSPEMENIEWDIPVSEVVQSAGKDDTTTQDNWLDFSKLSLGTEMRNKIWEEENKESLGGGGFSKIPGYRGDSTTNTNFESCLVNGKSTTSTEEQMIPGGKFYNRPQNLTSRNMFDFPTTRSNNMRNGFHSGNNFLNPNSPSFSPSFSPSNHGQVTSHAEESVNGRTENRFGFPGPGGELRVLQNDNHMLHRQVVELKAVLGELHALQSGSMPPDVSNPALPDPVYLCLSLLKMEQQLQEKTEECRAQSDKITTQSTEMEKARKEREFEVAKLKKDVKVIQEKLDEKVKEQEEKSSKREEKYGHGKNGMSKLAEELKEELKKVKEEKEKLNKELEDSKAEMSFKESTMKIDAHRLEQEIKTLKDHISQSQEDEVNKKEDLERMFLAARETVDKERQDKYMLLVEQNKLKHKVEKLTESLKSYQIKNDELTRIQNELEQEVDGFRKLKKLIHEHGLPNHDQLIMLQQQAESYKEDVLSERKDRERAQAQREKLRRDFETSQTRLSSLQEQVYKYQEHIMKLNTDRQRLMQQLDAVTGQNHGSKLIRQLSTPNFMGSKLNFDRTLSKNQFSPPNQPRMRPHNGPGPGGPFPDDMMRGRGFRNGFNQAPQRAFNDRRPPSGGPFDGWQRSMDQQRPMQGQGGYSMMNKAPRSPLLNPQAEPWRFGGQQNVQQNQSANSQFNSGLGYNGGIWSQQQGPRSPSSYGNMRSTPPNMWQFPTSEHQNQSGFQAPQISRPPGIKPTDTWSTVTDEQQNHPVVSQEESLFPTPPPGSSDNSPESGSNSNNDVYVCRKCDSKYMDGESFRSHVEKCFSAPSM
eukprot:gene12032-13274_t